MSKIKSMFNVHEVYEVQPKRKEKGFWQTALNQAHILL